MAGVVCGECEVVCFVLLTTNGQKLRARVDRDIFLQIKLFRLSKYLLDKTHGPSTQWTTFKEPKKLAQLSSPITSTICVAVPGGLFQMELTRLQLQFFLDLVQK